MMHESALAAYEGAVQVLDEDCLPLEFHQGDAFDVSNGLLMDASTVYCYSTTWDCDKDLVLTDLSRSLAVFLQPGAIVGMTDRKLAESFGLVDTVTGPNAERGGATAISTVYLYRLVEH